MKITKVTPDLRIVPGTTLELECTFEGAGSWNSCVWKKLDNTLKCDTFTSGNNVETECSYPSRAKIINTDGSCKVGNIKCQRMIHKYSYSFVDQLKVENVDGKDAGKYHCMIRTFLNQLLTSSQVISVVGEHEDISTVEQVPYKRD